MDINLTEWKAEIPDIEQHFAVCSAAGCRSGLRSSLRRCGSGWGSLSPPLTKGRLGGVILKSQA